MKSKDRIYIKHWLALKPQGYNGNTDLYYLKIANQVYSNLIPSSKTILSQYLSKDDLFLFCCFLTSYFEDVISQINIWRAFKVMYKELYDKNLPFYPIKVDYFDEEINFDDVAFLTWYFLNTTQENKFFSPYNNFILNIATTSMKVFDEAYEYAPENKRLKKLYTLNNKNIDYYTTRSYLQLVYFESYLFNTDIKFDFDNDILDTIEEYEEENPESIPSLLREITEEYTFNRSSTLLSLKAKDWAKSILGKEHPEYHSINAISDKITGSFFYVNQNENDIILKHIASNIEFNVTKKSFDYYENLSEDDIIYIGLVKWNNEWWFSGNFSTSDFDADLILDLKNSNQARLDVSSLYNTSEINDILKKKEKVFLAFNNSPIAFLKANTIASFSSKYFEFYNQSLGLSDIEKKEVKQRTLDDGYFGNDPNFEDFDSDEPVIVFFNPKSGLEFYFDIINAFPDINNPFFTEESYDDIMHLLLSPTYSKELILYFVSTYKDKLTFFKNEPYKSYLEDLDFLLRFWKKGNYHTKSSIIPIGINKES